MDHFSKTIYSQIVNLDLEKKYQLIMQLMK
jgi:hypothetical protein